MDAALEPPTPTRAHQQSANGSVWVRHGHSSGAFFGRRVERTIEPYQIVGSAGGERLSSFGVR